MNTKRRTLLASRRRNNLLFALLLGAIPLPAQHVFPTWTVTQVPDSGFPRNSDLFYPRFEAVDNAAYAFWAVDDPVVRTVWSRSQDYGRTWTPLAPFLPGTMPTYHEVTILLARGDEVIVTGSEWTGTTWQSYLATSQDEGSSWTRHPGPLRLGCNQLLEENGTLIWTLGPWLFVSTDRGATWQGPRAIAGAGTYLSSARVLEVHLQNGILHAVWEEFDGTTRQAHYNRSEDLGLTWLPVDRTLYSQPFTEGYLREVIVTPEAVVLAWDSSAGCHVDRSLDDGRTWLPTPVTIAAVPTSSNADFAHDGKYLVAFWAAPITTWSSGLYCVRSADHGATWSGPPTLIRSSGSVSAGPGTGGLRSAEGWLELTFVRRYCWTLPCVWISSQYVSGDGGATWTGAGGRGYRAGGSTALVSSSGSTLYGLWQTSWGPNTPWTPPQADCLAGLRPLGGSAPGTTGVAPVIEMDRIPVFDTDRDLHLRHGLPGAPAILALGTRRAPVPFFAGQLMIEPTAGFFLPLGSATSATPGAAALTFRLPLQSMLWQFCSQAFVLDPGAAGGVAMTEAIEVRIY